MQNYFFEFVHWFNTATRILSLIGLFSVFLLPSLQAQDIVINEVMSSNGNTLADEKNDFPDWIELFNKSEKSIKLEGWLLSDNADELDKWAFPGIEIAPGAYSIIFASGTTNDHVVVEWETVIQSGDSCRYLNINEDIGNFWFNPRTNVDNWPRGKTGIGYGDNDDKTVVQDAKCIYLRQFFSIKDADAVAKLLLHIDYDDAFVAYLNGVEVARANVGTTGTPPAFDLSATRAREAEMYRGGDPELFDLDAFRNILFTGSNLLAIEVHNYGTSSSDMSIIPFLTIGYSQIGVAERNVAAQLNLPVSSLHTNFKIKTAGESVFLSDSQGHLVDSCQIRNLPTDISTGRYPDGTENWFYFENATPGTANKNDGYRTFSPSVQSTQTAGFYENAVTISLSTPGETAAIYYTLNGAPPTENATLYQSPIALSTTTVLKARSFQQGTLPGPILTRTFFIGEGSELPVLSLSTAPVNLWDEQSGIYVKGPNAEEAYPYFNANFWQDWERPAHIEFFEKNQQRVFSVGCGIKIFGGWSRGADQKSLSLFFRTQYGPSTLEYPIFPDLDIETFEALVLRNSGNDWSSTMIRDGMMGSLLASVDVDRQAFRPAVLYINGKYWGIHNIREKINKHLIASHHGTAPANIDLL
ncbi:MAG: hypothetical protein DWQ10_18250 [Calditrichaeota bacterium]|nr:MAG: hypothetical protein DWQ10_18250 [Calditrichota bacterium]